ncbi:uncharacterized protein LOC111371911 [Olea europaea var. sylvestris]|uniref:uncharacterized protein LOC111371911 n=1 Tax=Olea europaea var. sylvestris TaxID=158386 RepID=UPI000C1D549A|nr:uncharacterized protein LOC111371911 [Olea europaea var. sylvestris]
MSICQLEVILELTPSIEEEAWGPVRDLGVPHTPDEEMPDPRLDRDWEGGPADRRSPPSGPSPPPFASSPPRVSSPPLASPPSRASPPLVASPPPGSSPPPLASPPSRHLPRVSPGHSDDLYARLTGFIEEVDALRRDLTEMVDDLGRELTGRVDYLAGKVDYMTRRVDDMGRELTGRVDDLSYDVGILQSSVVDLQDTVAALRGDLADRRWGDRGDGGNHDREGGKDGDGEGGHPHFWRDETLESLWLSMEGVAPMGMGEGTTEGVASTGGAEEVATKGEAPTGGAEVVTTEGEAPMEGAEEVAPEVERTPGVIEGKRHAVDETKQVVGKRLRVQSQYVS